MPIYYTLESGTLKPCTLYRASASEYATLNAYPRGANVPPPDYGDGYRAVEDGFALVNGSWVNQWKAEELPSKTAEELAYDNAVQSLKTTTVSDVGSMTGDAKDALLKQVFDIVKQSV